MTEPDYRQIVYDALDPQAEQAALDAVTALLNENAALRQEIERLQKIEAAAQRWERADETYDPDDEYEQTLYAEWVGAACDLRAALATQDTPNE